jgi:hypothetical protein
MTTTHTQPAGCDLDSLEALLNAATPEDWVIGETYADMYDDGPGAPETVIRGLGGEAGVAVALDFGSNNPSWREANAAFIVAAKNAMPALIAAARAAQAPQVAQHAETIEQYVPPQAEILADEAKLYRDLTGDAMALGFDGVPAALEALRTVCSQAPQGDTRQGAPELAIELVGVRETMAEGGGFWTSCSGCHDTEDGHPTGPYSYSSVFGCALGSGCSECGGIGAVWDNTDYEAMAADWDKDDSATPAAHTCTPADERPGFEVWAKSKGLSIRRSTDADHGIYIEKPTRDAWEVWQARAAQGAGTAPAKSSVDAHTTSYHQGYMAGIEMGKAMAADDPAPVSTAAAPASSVRIKALKGADTKQLHVVIEHPFGTSWVRMSDRRDFQLAELLVNAPAATVSTSAATTASTSIDHEDLDNTAKEALRDLSHVENHLEQSGAPTTIKNRAVDVRLCIKELRAALKAVAVPSRAADGQQGASRAVLDKDTIRAVFMRHGFTVKEGQTDLKDYVYAAADELVALARAPLPAQGNDVAATSAGELTDREIMEEWDRHYLPGKAKGVPFLRTVVEFARHFIEQSATSASALLPAQDRQVAAAWDAARREAWLMRHPRWSVRWRIHTKKQIEQWQMVDDGEPWGQWGDYRKVLDAVIAAQSRAQSDTTGENHG